MPETLYPRRSPEGDRQRLEPPQLVPYSVEENWWLWAPPAPHLLRMRPDPFGGSLFFWSQLMARWWDWECSSTVNQQLCLLTLPQQTGPHPYHCRCCTNLSFNLTLLSFHTPEHDPKILALLHLGKQLLPNRTLSSSGWEPWPQIWRC